MCVRFVPGGTGISAGYTAVMATPNWSHAKARLLFGTGFRKILVVVKHSAYEVRAYLQIAERRSEVHVRHPYTHTTCFGCFAALDGSVSSS